ncbi:sensor domain-containing diguanylate cyclase [Tianweitania sediminis]|uniref:diguanylate cyclase n=1 Tax=Tianweitania sediminis TaxID=1502156 RepID=A0A8J7R1W7_9HYPH|nr:sensor domain-containing diguanylate cyclase [Tianweitania sediminis]MBP0438670.1 sensor domain-containing diguanylate cyclase [Tianweitania sediminis]
MQDLQPDHRFNGVDTRLNEDLRLSALDELDLLDTPREEAFDRIARLIRYTFKVPVALISLMDAHRQWHKACIGLEAGEAERKDTFCRYPVASGEPLVIPDARLDPRVADNPHVTGPSGIRFYAGIPLKVGSGEVVGTLCAIDFAPREFSEEDLAALQDLAAITMREIELRQVAGTDALTDLLSRRAFKERALSAAKLATRHKQALSCLAIDIDHFKQINDTHGHAAGDAVLKAVATASSRALRTTDLIGRLGGEEFAALLPSTDRRGALEAAEKLRRAVQGVRVELGNVAIRATASVGVASLDPFSGDFDLLLAHADEAMYGAKRAGRNRTVVWQGAQTERRRVLKAGRIVFNNRHSTIDCTIRMLGEDGAGIDVWNSHDVPDRFTLTIGSQGSDRECKVTSRADKHIEVDFV